MIDLATEPIVKIDSSCCYSVPQLNGTHRLCGARSVWEIDRNDEVLAFTCRQHLEPALLLAYTNEADATMRLAIIPLDDFEVTSTGRLRPVPIEVKTMDERGILRRVDVFTAPVNLLT